MRSANACPIETGGAGIVVNVFAAGSYSKNDVRGPYSELAPKQSTFPFTSTAHGVSPANAHPGGRSGPAVQIPRPVGVEGGVYNADFPVPPKTRTCPL